MIRAMKLRPEDASGNRLISSAPRRNVRLLFLGTTSLVCLAICEPAAAQGRADGATVEEIVVTARQRAENLQDVPGSVAAITEGQLQAAGADTLVDLSSRIPSVQFGGNTVRLQTFTGMRGVGDYSRNPGFDNRVGIYIDGVLMGRSTVTDYPIFDIQQVEVARGPQGTLFGKDALTGVISITSRKPEETPAAKAMLTAGSRDLFGVSLMGNAPLGETLQGRLSLAHRQERGYVYNVARDVWLGGVRMWGGRLQLRYTGWDATTVDFTADYVRDRQNALLNRALGGPGAAETSGVREASFDASPIRERDLGGLALTIEHRLASGGSLVSITAFRASDSLFARNDLDLSSLDLASNQFADEDEAYSQELRFVSPAGDRFDYVVGLFFYHQTPKSDWVTRFGPAFPVPALHGQTVTSRADVESTTAAVYGHGTWRLTDRLSLEGGLRLNHVRKTIDFEQAGGTILGFPDIPGFRDKLKETSVDPRASIRFEPTEDVSVYLTYSRGTRSGGWNADFVRYTDIGFESESAENLEAGLKLTAFNRRLRLNTAVYHMKFDDLQVQQLLAVPGSTVVSPILTNAGSATSKGVEIDFDAAVTRRLSVFGGLAFNDATFDSFKSGGGPGVDYDGRRLIQAPRFTSSVTIEYLWPLPGDSELRTSVSHLYQSRTFSDPSNLPVYSQDAFGLVNARAALSWADRRWEVAVWARNLGDVTFAAARGQSGLNFPGMTANEPRTVGVDLTYRY